MTVWSAALARRSRAVRIDGMGGALAAAPTPFAHLQARNVDLYRAVLDAFVRAKERFTVHLRPEDVLTDLCGSSGVADLRHAGVPGDLRGPSGGTARPVEPVDLEAVTNALEQLVAWGNLRADPDTGRVTTVEDFHRARYLFQLSPAGQAAEQAIAVYEQAVGSRGALQSVALADIASQLRALLVLAEEAAIAGAVPDAARVHLLLLTIAERFTGLADNAQAFMASLRRTIDFADTDVEAFVAYKERLIGYIERFIADLANSGAETAALVMAVERAGVDRLLLAAGRREAADAAPLEDRSDVAAGASAASLDRRSAVSAGSASAVRGGKASGGAIDAAVTEAVRHWHNRWAGLRAWFLSPDARRPSQAKLLRAAAINAITQLLGAVAVINERRAGRSDRSADFRTLARWFAQAPDDASAHRLWRAAFGLCSARHLSVTAATLNLWEGERYTPNTPWTQAHPMQISPQLRRSGSYERRGQPNRLIDRSAARKLLAERARAEAEQAAAARATLVTDGPIRLSDLKLLDPLAFRMFLALLGDALAAKAPSASEVTTASGDGMLWIRLTEVPDAPAVEIETMDGVLTGPEHLIEIVVPSGAAG